MTGDFSVVVGDESRGYKSLRVFHKRGSCDYIWNIDFYEYTQYGREQIGSAQYVAVYGRGLEDLELDNFELTEDEASKIEMSLGEMVQDFCRDRYLYDADLNTVIRKATRCEAYESLVAPCGIIIAENTRAYVQF
jgi:hypothetical protein